jgi:hypothetical protein
MIFPTLLLAALTAAAQPAGPAESRYDSGDFSLVPPKGWALTERSQSPEETKAVWQAGPLGDDEGYLSIRCLRGADMTDDARARRSAEALGGKAKLVKIGDKVHGYVRAYQARHFGAANPAHPEAQPRNRLSTVFVYGNTVEVVCDARPRDSLRAVAACEAAIRSIRLAPAATKSADAVESPAAPAAAGAVPLLR